MRRLPRLADYTQSELLRLYGEVMTELKARGFVRSGNSPVADTAERIVADMYGGELVAANTAGHDVLTPDGTRIQVKGLRKTGRNRRNLSPIRSDDYDLVIAVVFEADMTLRELWRIPKSVVRDTARWSDHVNGYFLSLKRAVCEDDRVERIDPSSLPTG